MANGIYYIRGIAYYAKILGNPVDNYNKDGKEWTIEIEPDEAGLRILEELKLTDRLKKPKDGGKERILFRQREKRQNGDLNEPINVVDANNRPWDHDQKIGNGSVVDLKFKYTDYGKGKKAGVYPQAVRVLEHVEYHRVDFAPLNEEDRYFRGMDEDEAGPNPDQEPDNEDLDDDMPE